MKIKDIFEEIFKGLAIENDDREEKIKAFFIDTKDVENGCIAYAESKVQEIAMKVKPKFYLKPNDIIVSTRPSENTCHVGCFNNWEAKDIIAIPKKNFVILRSIKKDYIPEFIAEYLETIEIHEYFTKKEAEENKQNGNIKKDALTINDIEEIIVPKIPIEKQKEMVALINPINERNILYKKVITNDIEIKKYILNEVIKHEK